MDRSILHSAQSHHFFIEGKVNSEISLETEAHVAPCKPILFLVNHGGLQCKNQGYRIMACPGSVGFLPLIVNWRPSQRRPDDGIYSALRSLLECFQGSRAY